MNPSGVLSEEQDLEFYVEPPGSLVSELTRSLALTPRSTHLLLGGIGSGKTTTLRKVADTLRDELREVGEDAAFVDVSQYHALDAPELEGVMSVLAARALARRGRAHLRGNVPASNAAKAVEVRAAGWVEWVAPQDHPDYYDDYHQGHPSDGPPDDDEIWVPLHHEGLLVPPARRRPLSSTLNELLEQLTTIRNVFPGENQNIVFLFDSLDRLPDVDAFRKAVTQDLQVLSKAGLGVVVAGPLRFAYAKDRSVFDLFSAVHMLHSYDPRVDTMRAFLKEVLARRADEDFLTEDCRESLARASGGVLRDLLALAHKAGELAYVAGKPAIEEVFVQRAIDAFGRNLAFGLDDEDVAILKALHRRGAFVIRGDRELALIESRRVLNYADGTHVLHPTLTPLIEAMPGEAA